jgi:formylglycine-generating enzyme
MRVVLSRATASSLASLGVVCFGVFLAACEADFQSSNASGSGANSSSSGGEGNSGSGAANSGGSDQGSSGEGNSSAAASSGGAAEPGDPNLSVVVTGDGVVASDPAGISECGESSGQCEGEFDSGITVTLTASPSPGYAFASWSGACMGGEASVQVDTIGTKTCRATFAELGPVGPSCSSDAQCGDSCCTSLRVSGGDFQLGGDVISPAVSASVSDFFLGKYEVTISRFEVFVAANLELPFEGAGAHPLIPNSGWRSDWNSAVGVDSSGDLSVMSCSNSTWTRDGSIPMNCVTWYEAFWFCFADGGRLPTEAEWEYAASGGFEQRMYPWGPQEPTDELATYACNGSPSDGTCTGLDILHVGSKPLGTAKWGQSDLAGSMFEWVLDEWSTGYTSECFDCANVGFNSTRGERGGDWSTSATTLRSAARGALDATSHTGQLGFRCAYDL